MSFRRTYIDIYSVGCCAGCNFQKWLQQKSEIGESRDAQAQTLFVFL